MIGSSKTRIAVGLAVEIVETEMGVEIGEAGKIERTGETEVGEVTQIENDLIDRTDWIDPAVVIARTVLSVLTSLTVPIAQIILEVGEIDNSYR